MAADPYDKLPKEIEDAFITVSFSDQNNAKSGGGGGDAAHHHWVENASAQRVSTEEWSFGLFKRVYPNHSLVVADYINILGLPMIDIEPLYPDQMITSHLFAPLPRREAVPGIVLQSVRFGAFRVQFEGNEFIIYVAQYQSPPGTYGVKQSHYILHEGPEDPARELILTAGIWANSLHDEILVFNQGFWYKDRRLWLELQKADWKDVILDPDFKSEIRKDIYGFFKSEKIYKDLSIPWKRGLIMHGPPGNGKTISIKAVMKECHDKGFAPLYVKSFKSWMGEEAAMEQCFARARQEAPCVLILEDLDSLINDQNRSFFLNQLDGFENNDGILCIGTTNHLERIDKSLSSRPSRFDKKYMFDDPEYAERIQYVRYWQKKLKSNDSIKFPDSLVKEVAEMTDKFSFAYLKEAFVSTLFMLANQEESDHFEFQSLLKTNIRKLKKAIDDGKPEELKPAPARARPEPQYLPMPPENVVKEQLAKMQAQREARDLNSIALAAARIGRRFVY